MAGVEVDDPTQGMAKYLLSIPEIVSVVGEIPEGPVPWIFQDFIPQGVIIEGSQQSAIVVAQRGGWSAPNEHNRAEFPRMLADIYVDPLRDAGGNVTDHAEARRRVNGIHKIIDKVCHIPEGFDMMWGDVRVISSVGGTTFDVNPVPNGNGMLSGFSYYYLSLG